LCKWGKKYYGIDIKPGTIFNHKFPSGFFDVITLWDVLEHTPDPIKVLEECNGLLKKNGLLVVNYPDIGSWLARIMKRRWVFLLSVHLFYFDRKTIKMSLNKTGFKPVLFKPHFQKLALGYLVFRMKAYSQFLHKTGDFFTKGLHLENLQIPYWLGQTLVVARKK
jgi:SAM-dependent methyltransferase